MQSDELGMEERTAFAQWATNVGIWDTATVSAIAFGSRMLYSPTLDETLVKWSTIRATGKAGQIDCIVCAGSGKLWPADSPCHACDGSGHWAVPAKV